MREVILWREPEKRLMTDAAAGGDASILLKWRTRSGMCSEEFSQPQKCRTLQRNGGVKWSSHDVDASKDLC